MIKQRSPNYPGFDLGEAIEILKQIYPKVQRGEFTFKDAASAWGYNTVSGPVRRRFSALRQYGLLEQRRGDNAKLTPRALTLVLRNPASTEYVAARREAALEPDLIRELYQTGKFEAADDALRQDLIVHRGFTDDGADRFIEVLRSTLTIAGLAGSGTMASQEDEEASETDTKGGGREMVNPPPPPPPAVDKFVLSVAGGPTSFRMELPLPLSASQWTQLKAMLDAVVEPTLVGSPNRGAPSHQAEAQRTPSPTTGQDNGLVSFTRESDPSLTPEAEDLLSKADSGGVPAFMTANLIRIAEENGLSVSPNMTPNQLIAELRRMVE